MQNFIALAIVSVAVLAPVAIVYATLQHRREVIEMRLKAMLDLTDRGASVPFEMLVDRPSKPGLFDLRLGMVLVSTGTGLLLFFLTLPVHTAWGVGLLPLFTGIGFLVTWKIARTSETSGTNG